MSPDLAKLVTHALALRYALARLSFDRSRQPGWKPVDEKPSWFRQALEQEERETFSALREFAVDASDLLAAFNALGTPVSGDEHTARRARGEALLRSRGWLPADERLAARVARATP